MYAIARRGNLPFEQLSREFDRMIRGYFGDAEVPSALAPYPVDVREDADHFYVDAELPGFKPDDIDVTLENGTLTIRAERKEEQESRKGDALHTERRWTTFHRSFTLPTAVNESRVNADLKDGVLTITLDKREEVKPRKIKISNGSTGSQPVDTK